MLVLGVQVFGSSSWELRYWHCRSSPSYWLVVADDHSLAEEVETGEIDTRALRHQNQIQNCCSKLEILYALDRQVLVMVHGEVHIDHLDLVLWMDLEGNH